MSLDGTLCVCGARWGIALRPHQPLAKDESAVVVGSVSDEEGNGQPMVHR